MTVDVFASVTRRVMVILGFQPPVACVEPTVEGFDLVHPELEIATIIFRLAGKGNLWLALLELIQNLAIRDITHLMILLDGHTLTIADTFFPVGHHRIARIVRIAHIAVDTTPTVLASAVLVLSRCSIDPVGERATGGRGTVIASIPRWARALAGEFVARGELMALEGVELAVETWRALRGAVVEGGEEGAKALGIGEILCGGRDHGRP